MMSIDRRKEQHIRKKHLRHGYNPKRQGTSCHEKVFRLSMNQKESAHSNAK
jgi:hypothetical protein